MFVCIQLKTQRIKSYKLLWKTFEVKGWMLKLKFARYCFILTVYKPLPLLSPVLSQTPQSQIQVPEVPIYNLLLIYFKTLEFTLKMPILLLWWLDKLPKLKGIAPWEFYFVGYIVSSLSDTQTYPKNKLAQSQIKKH